MRHNNFFDKNNKYNKNPQLFRLETIARDVPQGKNNMCTRENSASSESGMATAEYAIVTLAAVGLAGLLIAILSSDEVRGFLVDIIYKALSGF